MGKASRKGGERSNPNPALRSSAAAEIWYQYRSHLAGLGAVWALALLAYANSFTGGLVRDNTALIRDDPRIQAITPANLELILSRDYWYGNSISETYRPVTTLSFLFNYAVLGDGAQPGGYHRVNIALHLINIALVYGLMLRLFGIIGPAMAATALWAVHPVLTESVTNIVGRADMLAGLGIFGGLFCHVQAAEASGRRRWAWLAGLAAVVAAGMFAKESALVVLPVLLLYDVAFRSARKWRDLVLAYVAAAAPCIAFLCVRTWVIAHTPFAQVEFTDNPLLGAGFWTARLTAVRVLGEYLRILFWPARLSADYSYNQIPMFSRNAGRADVWIALSAAALCTALLAIGVTCFRRNRAVFFLAFFSLGTLLPTSNLLVVIGTIMAERFLYVPAAGIAGCLVALLLLARDRFWKGRPQSARAWQTLAAALCLALAARTFVRNLDWADERSIQMSVVESAPESFRGHMALTALLAGTPAAVEEADRTLAILDALSDEQNAMRAYWSAGIAYRQRGEQVGTAGAGPWYRKSLQTLLRARSIERAHERVNRLGNQRRGKRVPTRGWHPIYLELGRTYLKLNQPHEALQALQHGLTLEVRPEFFEEMAAAHRAAGDPSSAAIDLLEGLVIDTTQTKLSTRLAALYDETAPGSCALTTAGGERSLNLECPLVRSHFCAAVQKAVQVYREAGSPDKAARTLSVGVSQYGCPAGGG